MRGWLLDTNVISELRKARADSGVVTFMDAQPGGLLYVSEITFGEIRYGIEQIPEPSRRADLQFWLDHSMRPLFSERLARARQDIRYRQSRYGGSGNDGAREKTAVNTACRGAARNRVDR